MCCARLTLHGSFSYCYHRSPTHGSFFLLPGHASFPAPYEVGDLQGDFVGHRQRDSDVFYLRWLEQDVRCVEVLGTELQ